jgi:hypothetical protein
LGIGDWAQSPIPNPQSPIPNPQSPIKFNKNTRFDKETKIIFIKYIYKITKNDEYRAKIYNKRKKRKNIRKSFDR